MKPLSSTFNSFFMAGFECADHINKHGLRINLQKITQHDLRIYEDYERLKDLNIAVVREGICWSEIEKEPYVFDFSRLIPFYEVAKQNQIQIIWDLCHFGFPDDLSPLHPQFTSRFEALAKQFCLFHCQYSSAPLWVIPINEISFLSWLSGEAQGTVPFATNNGWEIKYDLCKASIAAIKIIRDILPSAKILVAEPLIKVHDSIENPNPEQAQEHHEYQYQAVDILLGKICPELGGQPDMIDFIGINYYSNNQWTIDRETLVWPDPMKKRTKFSALLREIYERYQLPMLISETGNDGEHRSKWLKEIVKECHLAVEEGVDLRGICLYPIIDRPDWDNLSFYHQSGAWELDCRMRRIPEQTYIQTILDCQKYWYSRKNTTSLTHKNRAVA